MQVKRGNPQTLRFPVKGPAGESLVVDKARWWMGVLDEYRYGALVTPKTVHVHKGTTNSDPPYNSGITIETFVEAGQTFYRALVSLTHDDTKNIPPAIYFHELEVTLNTGEVQRPDLADVNVFELLQNILD